jgi:nucleotide-binding universal stress UspA family protein
MSSVLSVQNPLLKVVIGTSLSAESDHVVETGIALARASGARVFLVHAYFSPPAFLGMAADSVVADDWWEVQRKDLARRLTEQAERFGLDEVGGTTRLELGAPHQVLLDIAGEVGAGLIVAGTHEEDRRWTRLGSTADRLIRKTHCPVLAVRPGSVFPPAKVLAPVDFSIASASALRRGLGLLTGVGGSDSPTVEALFVLNPLEQAGSLQFTPGQIARFASDELERFLGTHMPATFANRYCRVRTGYPAEEVLGELREWEADLVMLGTHGRSGLERMLIGSVAADVLQGAPCSVLIVPPDPEAVEAGAEEEAVRRSADWTHVPDVDTAPAM